MTVLEPLPHPLCEHLPQLKEFGKAEADCDAALRLDPRHVKSLQRRAAARNALGKHRAALGDLQAAAEIDPSSKEVGAARHLEHIGRAVALWFYLCGGGKGGDRGHKKVFTFFYCWCGGRMICRIAG